MPRDWRWEGRALAILFGIGLILWPFLSFGAAFMFDSPLQNRSDEVNRYVVCYFIWSYPVTYAATCFLYYILRRCGVWRWMSCLAWGLPIIVYFIFLVIVGRQDVDQLNAKRVQLLYRTDHVALLAACREIMTNPNAFAKDPKNDSFIDLKDSKLPAVINALQPTYIGLWSYTGSDVASVSLGLHDGIDHLIVIAYSEQFLNSHTNSSSSDLQLIPGLVFSDHELTYQDTNRTNYINKLKAMQPIDAPTPKW